MDRARADPGPRPPGAERVRVRAVQRPRRLARQPRRGRTARTARLLPQRRPRTAPAALRRGRLRLPGVGSDGHRRHQRQGAPAAGRRRAVRPALRAARRSRADPGPAPGRAGAGLRVDLPGRVHGPGALHPPGLPHPAGDRRRRLRGGTRRPPDPGGGAVRTGRQREPARTGRRPARRPHVEVPAGAGGGPRQGPPAAPGAPHPAQRPEGRGGRRPRRRRPRTDHDLLREQRGRGPADRHLGPGARAAAAGGEARRPRLVRRPLPPRHERPGGGRAGGRRAQRLAGAPRRTAGVPGRLLVPGRRRGRR
ncbi:hypothetical protein SGRIM128S_00333 [Streptomyces griseomycini]